MKNIGDLAIMLEKKYEVPKEEVLFELIKIEHKYHSKVLKNAPNAWRFDRCYFLLAAGYLSNQYKKTININNKVIEQ